jgi:hypothetical protein
MAKTVIVALEISSGIKQLKHVKVVLKDLSSQNKRISANAKHRLPI